MSYKLPSFFIFFALTGLLTLSGCKSAYDIAIKLIDDPVAQQKLAPKILFVSDDQTLEVGQGTNLLAEVSGAKPLKVEWKLRENQITNFSLNSVEPKEKSRSKDDDKNEIEHLRAQLPITNITPEFSGQYVVRVSNDFGLDEVIVNLNVISPPQIISLSPSANVTVKENDPFEIKVQAVGDKPLIYQWRKNNKIISGANSPIIKSNNSQLSDIGHYLLSVTNKHGEVRSQVISLNVLAKPRVKILNPPDQALVTKANMNEFKVEGECSERLKPVEFLYASGLTATTTCSNSGRWNHTFDFTSLTVDKGKIINIPFRASQTNNEGTTQANVNYQKTLDTVVTIHYPYIDDAKNVNINSHNYNNNSFQVGGSCSESGRDIFISGQVDGSPSAKCVKGFWSAFLSFTTAPDGTVSIEAKHSSIIKMAKATRSFNKDTQGVEPFTNDTVKYITKENMKSFKLKGKCSTDTTRIDTSFAELFCSLTHPQSCKYYFEQQISCKNGEWITELDLTSLPESLYQSRAIAYDVSENKKLLRSETLIKDTLDLSVTIEKPVDQQILRKSELSYRFYGKCSEIQERIEIYINGQLKGHTACSANLDWLRVIDLSSIEADEYEVKVVHIDKHNGELIIDEKVEHSITIFKDTSIPMLTVDSPKYLESIDNNNPLIVFTGKCSNPNESITFDVPKKTEADCKEDGTWLIELDFTNHNTSTSLVSVVAKHIHTDGSIASREIKLRNLKALSLNIESRNLIITNSQSSDVKLYGSCSPDNASVTLKNFEGLPEKNTICKDNSWFFQLDLSSFQNPTYTYNVEIKNSFGFKATSDALSRHTHYDHIIIPITFKEKVSHSSINPKNKDLFTLGLMDRIIYKSTDNGLSWKAMCKSAGSITKFLHSPNSDNSSYFVDYYNRLRKITRVSSNKLCPIFSHFSSSSSNSDQTGGSFTIDNKGHLHSLEKGLPQGDILDSLVLWKSEDQGKTWQSKFYYYGPGIYQHSLSQDYNNTDLMLMSRRSSVSAESGSFYSDNAGTSWTQFDKNAQPWLRLSHLGKKFATKFYLNHDGFYYEGANFSKKEDKNNYSFSRPYSVHISKKGKAVRATSFSPRKVEMTDDISAPQWRSISSLDSEDLRGIEYPSVEESTISYILNSKLQVSKNSGANFVEASPDIEHKNNRFAAMDSADGKNIYAVTNEWAVVKSTDAGSTWSLIYQPHHNDRLRYSRSLNIHVNRKDPKKISLWCSDTYCTELVTTHDDFKNVKVSKGPHNYLTTPAFSMNDSDLFYIFGSKGVFSEDFMSTSPLDVVTMPYPFNTNNYLASKFYIINPNDKNKVWILYGLHEFESGQLIRRRENNLRLIEYDRTNPSSALDLTTRTGLYEVNKELGIEFYQIAGMDVVKDSSSSSGYILRTISSKGKISTSTNLAASFEDPRNNPEVNTNCSRRILISHPNNSSIIATACRPGTNHLDISYNGGQSWSESVSGFSKCQIENLIFTISNELLISCRDSSPLKYKLKGI